MKTNKEIQNFRFLCKLFTCFILFFFISISSFAEGSKDLYPAGAKGGRAYLRSATNESGAYPFMTLGNHFVYVRKGEWISMASSMQGFAGSRAARIRLFDPDGNQITLDFSNNKGNIPNRSAELSGPAFPEQNTIGSQYRAVYHQATKEGIYKIQFLSDKTNGSTNKGNYGANDHWVQEPNTTVIAAWDVSVCNENRTKWINGRVFMYVGNFSISGPGKNYKGGFYGKFKILTGDGYVYDVDNNGMNGYQFSFMVNNRGFHSPGHPDEPLYKSIKGSSRDYIHARYHDPRKADIPSTTTDKIFYNLPDRTMPDSAIGGQVPGKMNWMMPSPQILKVSDVSFTGAETTPNQMGSTKGGFIDFTSSISGSYAITIKPTGTVSFAPRTLTGAAIKGKNRIYFDGKDGNGNQLPIGQIDFQLSMEVRFAEVHFPYCDVEMNPYGIIIELLKNDFSGVASDIVYWDDSNIPKVNEHEHGPNANPITNLSGISSKINGHKWAADHGLDKYTSTFGDKNGMDTWTYIQAETHPSVHITNKEADLKIANLTSDKVAVKNGDFLKYTIQVANEGPSDVKNTKFTFTLPTGFKDLNDVSFNDNSCGSENSKLFYNSNTRTYTSNLNLSAGCKVTYSIKTKVGENTIAGVGKAEATILRPNDVSDPDATNLTLKDENGQPYQPTDAHEECANNGLGGHCNNIKELKVKVLARIAGTVYYDANGLTDNKVNGFGLHKNLGLHVVLADKNKDIVSAIVPVNTANGNYLFTKIPAGDYSLILTTEHPNIGDPIPEAQLPIGWVNTGEYKGNDKGDDGKADGILSLNTLLVDQPNANFGIEELPTSGKGTSSGGLNRGNTHKVIVPSETFTNKKHSIDPDPGKVNAIRITNFPTNASSITINNITYTSISFPSTGVIIPTNNIGNPKQDITVTTGFNGSGSITIGFVAIDNAEEESLDKGTAVITFKGIKTISGRVFNDVNGLTDDMVNGTGTNAGGIHAVLYHTGGNVVATTPVASDGTFSFKDQSGGIYSILITSISATIDQNPPTIQLPEGWTNTGEHFGSDAGDDGIADGILSLGKIDKDTSKVHFGIEQIPSAGKGQSKVGVNLGNNKKISIPPNTFNNIIYSKDVNPGEVTNIKITNFPHLAYSLFINGTKYTSSTFPSTGVNIPTDHIGTPSHTLSITTNFTGSGSITIDFVAVDNANEESLDTGTAVINYSGIDISGQVLNDINGLTDDIVNGQGTNAGGLNAILYHTGGNVVATVSVNSDGDFVFQNQNGGKYSLLITTDIGIAGSSPPSVTPPKDWGYTGEYLGAGSGSDGNIDGILSLGMISSNTSHANFGIDRLPIAGKGWIDVLNTDKNEPLNISKNVFSNIQLSSDSKPGEIDYIQVLDYPTGGVAKIIIDGKGYDIFSWPSDGVPIPTNVDGTPTVPIKVAPNFQGMGDVLIPFFAVDNAGLRSTLSGLGTIHFSTTHEISGTVYYDANGLLNNRVDGTALKGDLGLNVILADKDRKVFAYTKLNVSEGNYKIEKIPNGNYTIILTTQHRDIGEQAPLPNLPNDWQYKGEHIGTAAGDDGKPDGILKVHIKDESLKNVNFGISQKDNKFFIPNYFTPNGDGHNDYWKVFGNNIKDIVVTVYNQYGQKIYESKDISGRWNGKYKGALQPTGVYIYYVKMTFYDGRINNQKGSLTLIR